MSNLTEILNVIGDIQHRIIDINKQTKRYDKKKFSDSILKIIYSSLDDSTTHYHKCIKKHVIEEQLFNRFENTCVTVFQKEYNLDYTAIKKDEIMDIYCLFIPVFLLAINNLNEIIFNIHLGRNITNGDINSITQYYDRYYVNTNTNKDLQDLINQLLDKYEFLKNIHQKIIYLNEKKIKDNITTIDTDINGIKINVDFIEYFNNNFKVDKNYKYCMKIHELYEQTKENPDFELKEYHQNLINPKFKVSEDIKAIIDKIKQSREPPPEMKRPLKFIGKIKTDQEIITDIKTKITESINKSKDDNLSESLIEILIILNNKYKFNKKGIDYQRTGKQILNMKDDEIKRLDDIVKEQKDDKIKTKEQKLEDMKKYSITLFQFLKNKLDSLSEIEITEPVKPSTIPQQIPQQIPQRIPQQIPQRIPQQIPTVPRTTEFDYTIFYSKEENKPLCGNKFKPKADQPTFKTKKECWDAVNEGKFGFKDDKIAKLMEEFWASRSNVKITNLDKRKDKQLYQNSPLQQYPNMPIIMINN